jgi:hypothetical protein
VTPLDIRSRVRTFKDAERDTGLSPKVLKDMAATGQLRTVTLGRRRYIPVAELERLAKEVGA